KGDVKDEAIKLIDYIQNPGDEAATLRGLLFMQFLGGSVASAMVNMTQTFTMTLPYLAQFGGDVAGNMKEAMGISARLMFNKNASVPEDLKMALQRASDEGVVSPHEIHMLQGESMRTGWFQNNRYMRSIGKVWGSLFSLAEHFNRNVAFIAAYRSALQRNLSDEQAYEFAKDAVRETQGVYCVDTDTEILTAEGWKRFDQLKVGEQVFTVDMDGNLVHDALKNVHVFGGQHEVTEFRNANGFSMVVTDDHRNLVQNYSSRDKKWQRIRAVKTRDLKTGHFLLRAPLGDATGREQIYSDDQVRLLAWVAAEGHFFAHRNVKEKRGVGIVQSDNHNPMYVIEIDALLERLGGHFNRKVGKNYRKMVCWQLRKPLWMFIHEALPQKRVTMDLLSKLTVPQMRIFLETFTKADGTIPDVGGSSIGQKSVETLNTLQAMAVLSGQTSTLWERQKNLIEGGFRDYGSLYLAKNSIRAYLKECTKERRVIDTVWCPETSTGTWIARRNGRTFITGNSRANKPNWARGAVGATIFTFKQFSIGYMEFLKRLPPRERALALGILWVFAGISGMPFSDDLDDLIDTIAHMLGFAWDNKAKKRAFVAGVFGRDAGEYIMNGVSAGLPLDISGRMGLANLIPATGVLDPSKDRAKELSEVAGPAGAAIQTIVKAGDRMLSGIGSMRDVRDIARMSAPVAVANLMAGWNMAEDGYYTDTKGRKVVDTDMKDAFFKTLGFNPSVVSESSRAREEIFNRSAVLRDMKARISERWADGIANRNPDKVAEARAVLARWNENNPDDQIRVNMAGILRRAKEARATASDRAVKAAPKELRETAKMLVDGTD
ncbi:MAG: PLxRFG domain-containing protein, partial [Betaproteobacteria bacterium]